LRIEIRLSYSGFQFDDILKRVPTERKFLPKRVIASLAVARCSRVVSAEQQQSVVDEVQRTAERCHVADPDVVHRDVGREGQCLAQHLTLERHATARIAIAPKKIREPSTPYVHQLEERLACCVQKAVRNPRVAHHAVAHLQFLHTSSHLALKPYYLFHVTEDKNKNIWLSTSAGPLYMTPNDVKNGGGWVTQHKVPRNDGTNLADYLLSNVETRCIAVDGGNRKWIATSNGVFLLFRNFQLSTLNSLFVLAHFAIF
jgi:hypothetical protein